jgi:hypothetical protein
MNAREETCTIAEPEQLTFQHFARARHHQLGQADFLSGGIISR